MNKKNITFVRHGTTQAAEEKIFPSDTTILSKSGQKEIYKLKDSLDVSCFDLVISSDLTRTVETAEILSPNKYIINDLFTEVKRPKFIENSPSSQELWIKLDLIHSGEYKENDIPSNEYETYTALWDRVGNSKEYLQNLPYENILIITHNIFIKMFIFKNVLNLPRKNQDFIEFSKNVKILNGTKVNILLENNQFRIAI